MPLTRQSKVFAAFLIAATLIGGMYAVADSTATNLAEGFATEASSHRTRQLSFSDAARQASIDHGEARAKCRKVARKARSACEAEAIAQGKRSFQSAFQP